MKILFFRHGNTFEPGVTPYFVGSGEDIPLSKRGEEQALEAAAAVEALDWTPDQILTSPLIRCSRFAELLLQEIECQTKMELSEELKELDYGSWGGLSDESVIAQFGEDALLNWRNHAVFPPEGTFGEEKEAVVGRLKQFLEAALVQFRSSSKTIAISSNGILRFLPEIIAWSSELQGRELKHKVSTGHLVFVRGKAGLEKPEKLDDLEIASWNVAPLQWKLSS